MYPLSKEAKVQFKQTVVEYCKADGIPVRIGQSSIKNFLDDNDNYDLFLLWDALGCDELSFRSTNNELEGLYQFLGELYQLDTMVQSSASH